MLLSENLDLCTKGRKLKALLFDLDDTLYRSTELSTCVLEGIRCEYPQKLHPVCIYFLAAAHLPLTRRITKL